MRVKTRAILDAFAKGHLFAKKATATEEELKSYQVVGEVTAHQAFDG